MTLEESVWLDAEPTIDSTWQACLWRKLGPFSPVVVCLFPVPWSSAFKAMEVAAEWIYTCPHVPGTSSENDFRWRWIPGPRRPSASSRAIRVPRAPLAPVEVPGVGHVSFGYTTRGCGQ